MIQHSASDAALVALLAAIHRATGGRTARAGVGTERLTVYTSSQTHSSVEKACRVAGLGTRRAAHDRHRSGNLGRATRSPASPDRGRPGRGLHAGARRGLCRYHWCRGDRPGGGAGQIARSCGAWLHVDAAWAGVAAVCPELRWLNEGLESRRFLLHESAQMAADELRLRRDVGRGTRRHRRGPVDPAGVSPQCRDRIWAGYRLPRLACAAGPALPRAQAMGRDPVVRRRGSPRARPCRRRPRAGIRLVGCGTTIASNSSVRIRSPSSRSGCGPATMQLVISWSESTPPAACISPTLRRGSVDTRMAIGSPQTERRHVAAAWAELQQAADA